MDIKSLLELVGPPTATGIIMYFAGRRKNSTDIKKTEAEIEKLELDKKFEQVELFEKINKILSEQNEKLEKYIKELELRILELEKIVEKQNDKLCKGDDCPTKIAYTKIMVSREKRKRKREAAAAAIVEMA